MVVKKDKDIKVKAVADWLTGSTQTEIAHRYKLPKSTVSTWTLQFPRTAPVPQQDFRLAFGMSVYQRAMEALDALGSHLRAAKASEFAGDIEGWSVRTGELARIIVTLGSAIQRGQDEPIPIQQASNTAEPSSSSDSD